MRKIAIIGSEQSALLIAHGLRRAGHEVALYSDRTAKHWLTQARPKGTTVRFARSLAYERSLGLGELQTEAPPIDGLKLTICSHPTKPLLTLLGSFGDKPLAIDERLQSRTWLDMFASLGGHVVFEEVPPERVDAISRDHDLTIVAAGEDGGGLFQRDPDRSPASAPLRHLAIVDCEGPSMRFEDVPFAAAKLTVLEGLGECSWAPCLHRDRKPVWRLLFEAKLGTPYDRFQGARSGDDVLRTAKDIIREMMPWDYPWIADATLAGENDWLVDAITPIVRDPIGKLPSGRPVIPLGDAYMTFDPLGAQGANMGNRLASTLVSAIAERGDAPFDVAWIRQVYDAFHQRWGGPAMRWTHLLLSPMSPAMRYLMLAQLGADGRRPGGSPKQRLADAFAGNFEDPIGLCDLLQDFPKTRRWVRGMMDGQSDWEAAKGLFTVAERRLRNSLSR